MQVIKLLLYYDAETHFAYNRNEKKKNTLNEKKIKQSIL